MAATENPSWVPTGDLTIFEVDRFHQAFVTLPDSDGPIEVDLSHLERVDGSGMQLILAASRWHRVHLTQMPSEVSIALVTAGYQDMLRDE